MIRTAQYRFDVLVIGGGPAGIAAACRAAECGLHVGLIDDNAALGGQIWRGESEKPTDFECRRWLERIRATDVTALCGLRVFEQPEPGLLLAEGADEVCELSYRTLILATGARERFLPFPGWTLPNVMGAGGLQAMVKRGLPIRGKRVVIAGTGPLLLAVGAYLRKKGAEILLVCEQAPWKALAEFGMSLVRQPAKLAQGLQLKRELRGVAFTASCWPVAAEGHGALEKVTISRKGKLEMIACDYLACGFHLVPNTELPVLLGCQLQNGLVSVDELQRTTVPNVLCAGEPTGIGGVELSVVEGQIAGFAAGERIADARRLFGKRAGLRRFARTLDRTFRLREELRGLTSPQTIVCRCEDVEYSRLLQRTSWRAAKLHTRCGMGACQGRVCGPATQFLFKWRPDSVRPPVFPVRLASMAAFTGRQQTEQSEVTGGLR